MTAPAAASTLDFSSVGAQLNYYLTHIGQAFKGGWSGSGENGIDIPLPVGTPVYAVTDGDIAGKGYYGGGGVVSWRQQPGRVWYVQHLDLIEPSIESGQTTHVSKGQLLGWSGGQSGYGNHPASLQYSNDGTGQGWPHIEIGINAPWSGIWGGGEGPNVDPVPYLQQVQASNGSAATGTLQSRPIPVPGLPSGAPSWASGFAATFPDLFGWLQNPLRWVKLIGGMAMIAAGVLLFIIPTVAGPALQVAGVAAGNPPVAAAGRALTRNPQSILARGAEGYGQGLGAERKAKEQGRLQGVEQESIRQAGIRSENAKKAAETRKANDESEARGEGRPFGARAGKAPKPPKADKEARAMAKEAGLDWNSLSEEHRQAFRNPEGVAKTVKAPKAPKASGALSSADVGGVSVVFDPEGLDATEDEAKATMDRLKQRKGGTFVTNTEGESGFRAPRGFGGGEKPT